MPPATCTIVPMLRCQHDWKNGRLSFCGKPAVCVRPAAAGGKPAYFCSEHRAAGDLEIPANGEARRVRLTMDVMIAGGSWRPLDAEAEAAERIRAAIEAAGGVSSPVQVSSTVVHWREERPIGAAIVVSGNGE